MKKYFVFLVCAFALFSVVFRGVTDTAKAGTLDKAGWEAAAYRAVGDICAESEGAGIIYFYAEKNDVYDGCALGVKRAMLTCEPTVTWQGMVACKSEGAAESSLRVIAEYDIGVTHVLTDDISVTEECLRYAETEKSDIEVIYIPDIVR